MAYGGYDQQRFVKVLDDTFDCIICSLIAREPWDCDLCGKMFCKLCITDWMAKSPTLKCPLKCPDPKIKPVTSKALLRLYNEFDIKCINANCKKVVKLGDLQKHQKECAKVKCWNHANCQKIQDESVNCPKPCCSSICETLHQLHSSFGNVKKMYEILEPFFKNQVGSEKVINPARSLASLCWDPLKLGTGIASEEGSSKIFLKEQSYVFRSAVANIGFTSGINYWEIIADARTQNELKIGVSLSRDFDMNSAFCDHPFGYSYYGLGQLRHNSNASGPSYGKRFKKDGILGCCLNMDKGTLSFSLNGEYWGVAYTDEKLKQGPIYPAVSLLHCAGCKIRAGLPVPQYFNN